MVKYNGEFTTLPNILDEAFCEKQLTTFKLGEIYNQHKFTTINLQLAWDHSFSTYAKFLEKLAFLTP